MPGTFVGTGIGRKYIVEVLPMNKIHLSRIFKILMVGIFVLINHSAFAQPQPPRRLTPEEKKMYAEKRQKQAAQNHEQMLQHLKKTDPSQYEQFKAQQDRQKKTDQILNDFKKKKIPLSLAKTSLYPLAEADAKNDLATLDSRIKELQQKIEELKAKKINPSADDLALAQKRLQLLLDIKSTPKKLIDFRVDNLLGQIVPPKKDLLGETYP